MSLDCSIDSSVDFEEWGAILSAPLQGGRYPLSATLELTNRCNLNCAHCYINQAANDEAARERELSTEQVKAIIDQMVAAGVLFLTLTGGEPLLRPDFAEIYTYARQKGLLVILFTNGTLVSEEIADLFDDLRPFSVDISIYGASHSVFEAVTRVSGTFSRCYAGIERLLARGIPLSLKTELMTLNLDEIEEMKAFAVKKGLRFRYDGLLWPRIDGSGEFPREVQLPLDVVVNLDNWDIERQDAVNTEMDRLKDLKTRDERVFSCGAGLRSFHVDSEGRMSICMMVRSPSYSLLEIPLMEAWERLGSLRKMKRSVVSKCQSCTSNVLCSHCPGWSLALSGNYESVVEFVCDHGKLRTENGLGIKSSEIMEVIEKYE